MLAQDFHDLTGQVIQKIMAIAENIEGQLVRLLLASTPPEKRVEVDPTSLYGPAIDRYRQDVAADQGQVNDLLACLGF
ncbi:MAG: protein phosphatase CheZ [Burkholderiales bacterium]|nr:protein phosphatase CheZ [Burkholderiales bacterium]